MRGLFPILALAPVLALGLPSAPALAQGGAPPPPGAALDPTRGLLGLPNGGGAPQLNLGPQGCADRIRRDPVTARNFARGWARDGGGAAAAVCEALALEALGALVPAAQRLEEAAGLATPLAEAPAAPDPGPDPDADPALGPVPGLDPVLRARLLEAAAGFRLRAGDPAAALADAEAGLAAAENPILRRLKAEALADQGRTQDALAEIALALQADEFDVAALKLSARLHLAEGEAEAALDLAARAAALDPEDAAVWLEKGEAEAALARKPAARESFLEAISLDRDGRVGDLARAALQKMELN